MNKEPTPPRLLLRFFRWFCHRDYQEDIEGDLLERFEERRKSIGLKTAKRLFIWDVLLLFRPGIIRNISGHTQTTKFSMLKNYLKIALRIFKKEKGFTIINVLGLALGITCSLFIYLWVQDERSYNDFLKDGDRVCMVMGNEVMTNGEVNTYYTSPYNLKKVLEDQYPSVEQVTILSQGNWMAFEKGENLIEKEGMDASPEVFQLFEMAFLRGGHDIMDKKRHSIAISKSFAVSLFGEDWETKNLIGSDLVNEQGETYELAGIYADLPRHSTLKFDFVLPFEIRLSKNQWLKDWGSNASHIFVKLTRDVTVSEAQESLKHAIIDHKEGGESIRELFLHPFADMYLYNRFEHGKVAGGRIDYIRLLSIAAILILVLASINFMNLSTARSSRRAKETGVRKVLGALRSSLKTQFIIESLLISFMALLLSFLLVLLFLPHFNFLTGKQVSPDIFTPAFIIILTGLVFLIGFLSGLYPAFYLSSLRTITSLKGVHRNGKRETIFRKGLVVFQFIITIIMITGALVVYRQVSYIHSRNIGMDRSHLIRNWGHEIDPVADYATFKTELLKRPGIESVTNTNQNLIDINRSTGTVEWDGKLINETTEFYVLNANPDFIPTTRMNLKAGRNFDWSIRSDTSCYIINETAQRLMRMTNPIGETLKMWREKGKIIGVIEDFHNASLHSPIEPLIIRWDQTFNNMILTRSKVGQTKEALASMEEVYLMFNPKREFNFEFMDDLYNRYYKSEQMVKDLSLYFSLLAIIISCLGLFALVAYTAEQRTKEIGIRKILGATFTNILQLLSKDFAWLLLIAMAIAIPLAFFIMSGWLSDFAYRIELSWWLFGLAGLITLLIAYSIIGSHVIRSASTNPIESLKDE